MNNFFITKEGGLFDFDLTLPFIVLEFIVLSFLLDKIFYTPVQLTIEKRKSYINRLSTEINLLLKKGTNLLLKYENILTKEKINLNTDILNYNQICDSNFENLIKNTSLWNSNQIKKSKSVLIYQLGIMFESFDKTLKNTEKEIFKYLVN